jgi:hypothetical protein
MNYGGMSSRKKSVAEAVIAYPSSGLHLRKLSGRIRFVHIWHLRLTVCRELRDDNQKRGDPHSQHPERNA